MKVIIIGQGNVGTHLATALKEVGHDVSHFPARSESPIDIDADVVIISVKDSYVCESARNLIHRLCPVSQSYTSRIPEKQIPHKLPVFAHTSGSIALKDFHIGLISEAQKAGLTKESDNLSAGVFYPLQTFSRDVRMTYDDIPFLIEGTDKTTNEVLTTLASTVTRNVTVADSATRGKLHLASVMTCNFSNLLLTLADEYLAREGLDYHILLPLMRQTLKKASEAHPADVQTGPAARGDMEIIAKHRSLLADDDEKLQIYNLLTKSILNRHK